MDQLKTPCTTNKHFHDTVHIQTCWKALIWLLDRYLLGLPSECVWNDTFRWGHQSSYDEEEDEHPNNGAQPLFLINDFHSFYIVTRSYKMKVATMINRSSRSMDHRVNRPKILMSLIGICLGAFWVLFIVFSYFCLSAFLSISLSVLVNLSSLEVVWK